MGKIILKDIEVMARLLEEEQYAPQDLLVSMEVSYARKIRQSDEMASGVDYCDLIERVRSFVLPMMEKHSSDSLTYLLLSLNSSSPSIRSNYRLTSQDILKN